MTHTYTVLRPFDDGNVWDSRLNCYRSRPKSLDMAREYCTLSGTRTQYKQTPGFFSPLSIFVLKTNQNLISDPKEPDKPNDRNINGINTRPLTWGPNGSKFTDAIASLMNVELSPTTNRENELVTSPYVLADVTNKNVSSSKPKNHLVNESDSLDPFVNATSSSSEKSKKTLQKDESHKISSLMIAAASSTAENLSKLSSNPPPIALSREEKVERVVEDLLNNMINEIVRNEAFLKSQALFKANEMRLAHSIQLRKEIDKLQGKDASTCRENINVDLTTTTNHCATTQRNILDATPNMDEKATESRRRLKSEVFESGTDKAPAIEMSSDLLTPEQAVPISCDGGNLPPVGIDCREEQSSGLLQTQNNCVACELNIPECFAEPEQQTLFNSVAFQTSSCENVHSDVSSSEFDQNAAERCDILEETDVLDNELGCKIEEESISLIDQEFSNTSTTIESIPAAVACCDVGIAVENCIQQLLTEVHAISNGSSSGMLTRGLESVATGTLTGHTKDQLELLLDGIQETDLHCGAPIPQIQSNDPENCVELNSNNEQLLFEPLAGSNDLLISSEDLSDALDTTLMGSCDSFSSDDDSIQEATFVKDFSDVDDSSNDADEEDASDTEDLNDLAPDNPQLGASSTKPYLNLQEIKPTSDDTSLDINGKQDSDERVHTTPFHELVDRKTSQNVRETILMPESSESAIVKHVNLLNDDNALTESVLTLVENRLQSSTIESKPSETSQPVDNVSDPAEVVEKKLKAHNSSVASNIIANIVVNKDIDRDETRSTECLLDATEQNICRNELLKSELKEQETHLAQVGATQSQTAHKHTFNEQDKVDPDTDNYATPKRPTSLFTRKSSGQFESFKVFGILNQISPTNLTPAGKDDKLADIYSEATEKVLEEDKSLRRQESFSKPHAPVRYRPKIKPTNLQKVVHLEESDGEAGSGGCDVEKVDRDDDAGFIDDLNAVCSDTELIFRSIDPDVPVPGPTCHCFDKRPPSFVMQSRRSRSLPFNIKTDYCDIINFAPLDLPFDDEFRLEANTTTPTIAQPYSYFLNVQENRNKRDSALSRESAASSGTVVASEEDEYELPEVKEGHWGKTSKYSPSTQSPLAHQDTDDSLKVIRRFTKERSQSLDRHQRNSRRLAKYLPPPVIHQSNCGMMLSAPSITVTHECNSVHGSRTHFDPIMSSSHSLASTTSYMGDESDALRSSSIGSSPLSSPSNSPTPRRRGLNKPRPKSKILTHRGTKQAERQAAEACEWLKAAGFPQYVQLYEDGNFPVDIAGVSSDHDFLGQDHIAALVRRLNVLNKCANLKLDKTTSKDALTDNDEEELEQYALSDFWRFEENHHRWSRLDSKASSLGSPTTRSSHSAQKSVEGLNEESNGDVFAKDDTLRAINNENSGSEENRTSIDQPRLVPNKPITLKPKTHSFLKRVGDLKKIGSFRRKDPQQRPTVVEIPLDDSWTRSGAKSRHKSLRKTRNVTISKPVLQGGHEKFEQMKCTAIDMSPTAVKELQNQHRGRKPSSHSLMSSSSSSGGASTISTPASRRTRASTEDFSSDFGEISPGFNNRNRIAELNTALRQKDQSTDRDNSTFVIPHDYKPGTFPAALREKTEDDVPNPTTLSMRSNSVSESMQSVPENARAASRPMSVYDNLPETAIIGNVTAQDFIKILDPGSPLIPGTDSDMFMGSMESLEVNGSGTDPAFWSVDDIVEHTQNLQQMVGTWDVDDFDDDEDERNNSVDSTLDAPFPLPEALPSYNADNVSNVEDDSDTTSLTSSEQRNQLLLRWEPLKRENSDSSATLDNLQLHTLSACQLMMLRRLSMLKLTARMEQYALSNSKGTLSWSVPRFIRRMKIPDYKDKTVFGVPLLQNVQKFGQPLPICIQHALAYLRRTALDQIGLFRKPGVKGRIHKLRSLCELNPELEVFEDCSAYDIADLIKQYFRALPDPLMTMKMSETFIGIFLYVPENLWLQTLQSAILLLPDENRETLKTLLHFLADIASNFEENHMNAINLSTCFAPSLFYQQLNNARLMASTVSPKAKKSQGNRTLGLPGKPDLKAMSENKASNQCLAFMINHVNDLFKISEDATTQCRMSVMQQSEDVLASEIGYKSDHPDEKDYYADFHSYVDRVIRQTMREEQRFNQNRGWQSMPTATGCDLAYKKMNDGNPLRLWRGQVEVTGADPAQIMDRILSERHLWDPDLLQWKVLQQPDDRCQLFQEVRAEMSPQPSRDYCVLRSWRNDITTRGTAAIVEVSTGPYPLLGDVRGVVLTSRYVIDPTEVPNKCILTHMCRVDTKGRNPEWYNKAYGHIVSQHLIRIKDSIKTFPPKMTSLNA